MKNGKSSAAAKEIFYEDDGNWTPHERKFLDEMAERKQEMETQILQLIAQQSNGNRIYRTRIIHLGDLEPAYDFLRELQSLVRSHVCKDDTPLCWARELNRLREEFALFLSVHEIIYLTHEGVLLRFRAKS